MKSKKIIIAAIISTVSILIGGCMSEEQMEEARENEIQGAKNAIEW